ncbi:MAG: hypothetical protein KAR42_16955 [candidate division Zixibacteria bacterium]|nr:hypothetical protein [candidate division Zixibacteria bacterium]
MKKKKSTREKGNDFQRWIRDWLLDRSWTVRNFPMNSRPMNLPDPDRPGRMKLVWLPQDNDVFGCDLVAMKGKRRLWIQSSLDEHIQRRLDEFAKYWNQFALGEDLMLWIKREKWISVFEIAIRGMGKNKVLFLSPGGKIIRGRWQPDPGVPEWYFGEKIKKEKK